MDLTFINNESSQQEKSDSINKKSLDLEETKTLTENSSETQSDTSSEEQFGIEMTIKPMIEILKVNKYESFIINS